ncbi:MAG: nucleotidyltransferase [Bacteroidetes bacterium]|nr:MAG: nucleotidyltransferase [Bacteroidota bacterium]
MTDQDKDIRWLQRFSNFKKAYNQLCEFLEIDELNKFEKQGFIKAFEYTFELAWKSLQDLLKDEGYKNVVGPRSVIEQSFQVGYILDGEGWMEMLKRRNEASHTYQEEIAERIATGIREEFADLFGALLKRLEDEEGA